MSKELDKIVAELTSTYQSLAHVASGYIEILDPKEVSAALKKAKPDTAEYVALYHLDDLMRSKNVKPVQSVVEKVVE